MDPTAPCYTIVNDDSLDGMSGAHGTPTSMELRNALQKGSDEVKLDTMRRIIVDTLNGHNHVSSSSLHVLRELMLMAGVTDGTAYADHPICPSLAQQTDQEDPSLLLGVSTTVGKIQGVC